MKTLGTPSTMIHATLEWSTVTPIEEHYLVGESSSGFQFGAKGRSLSEFGEFGALHGCV